MGLNCTVVQFTNVSQSYKVYVNIEKDIFNITHLIFALMKSCHIEWETAYLSYP